MALALVAHGPAETEALAVAVAGLLVPGDVVLVRGEIGAGKTTFVRGACHALGVTDRVTSPTFTIGHRYAGRVAVSHLDLYRFAGLSAAEWGDLEPYFDDAIAFVNDREAFGQKVSQFQAVRHMLADNATKLEAARALTYKAAALMAAREPCDREITMAKVFATETCKAACLDGIQLLGGYGYSMEFPMQLYMRRSLIGTIGGGTTQVLRDVIGRFIGVK